jgi:hypothetical protein
VRNIKFGGSSPITENTSGFMSQVSPNLWSYFHPDRIKDMTRTGNIKGSKRVFSEKMSQMATKKELANLANPFKIW